MASVCVREESERTGIAEAATSSAAENSLRESSQGEQVELMSAGHAANAAGDFVEARNCFMQAYALGGRPEAWLSAANMALKLGDWDRAINEYAKIAQLPALPEEMGAHVRAKREQAEGEKRAALERARKFSQVQEGPGGAPLDRAALWLARDQSSCEENSGQPRLIMADSSVAESLRLDDHAPRSHAHVNAHVPRGADRFREVNTQYQEFERTRV